jgi:hypothetical protein
MAIGGVVGVGGVGMGWCDFGDLGEIAVHGVDMHLIQ